jgi:hypothetical protein
MIHRKTQLAILLLTIVTGCRQSAPPPRPSPLLGSGTQTWIRTELYCGLSRAESPDITPAEFQTFVDEVVTPRFPDGLSIFDADGQWRATTTSPIVREHSKVIVILTHGSPDDNAKLDEIRQEYKRRFHQDSVLKSSEAVSAEF